MLEKADSNKDGKISFEDFYAVMVKDIYWPQYPHFKLCRPYDYNEISVSIESDYFEGDPDALLVAGPHEARAVLCVLSLFVVELFEVGLDGFDRLGVGVIFLVLLEVHA